MLLLLLELTYADSLRDPLAKDSAEAFDAYIEAIHPLIRAAAAIRRQFEGQGA